MPGRDLAVLALVPLALHETFGDLTKAAQTMTRASSALRRVVSLLTAKPVGVGDRVVDVILPQAGPHVETPAGADDSEESAFVAQVTAGRDASGILSRPSASGDPQTRRSSFGGPPESTPEPALVKPASSEPSVAVQATVPVILPKAGSPVLNLDHLAIGWPGEPVLVEGVDLTVAPGQTVAVTAPSGVGKTTLAATLLGLIPPMGGSFDATPSIGYLAQDAHIFATTVAENVRIGNPRATDAEVAAALELAGLGHLDPERIVGEDGTTISGGEARRVALARLLVVSPRPALTILDEPTEHLDAETAGRLMDDIWATTLPDGALLVLTHDPGVVARCDREVRLATAG